MIRILLFLFLIFSIFTKNLIAQETEDVILQFSNWKEKLRLDAQKDGYNDEFLDNIFSVISYSDIYVREDKKQFKPQTFQQYYKNAINSIRVKKAKKRIKQHQETLKKVSLKFGVPIEYIVALWAIETDFGRITGDYNVLNSLANLSFDKRRRELFLQEFLAAVKVAQINNIKPQDFKGSWAGAVGQSQFLPTTYLNHGYDFNKDNIVDIWNYEEDVFASIANYLGNLGWNNQFPWGYEIKFNKNLQEISNKEDSYLLKDLIEKEKIETIYNYQFSKVELEQEANIIAQGNRMFITLKNFDLIKEWNRSTYFALSVGLLADKIKNPTILKSLKH